MASAHGSPDLVRDEVLGLLRDRMRAHPRSQQREIGASEVGTPCTRKLAARLGQIPAVLEVQSWPAYVGTALHAAQEEMLAANNTMWREHNECTRWIVEQPVNCGEFGDGRQLKGHVDCYDKVTKGVIDWKFPSPSSVTAMRRKGISPAYQVQRHLYGRGMKRAGFEVEWVGLLAIPTSGTLDQAYWDAEPYDESIAEAALARIDGLARLIDRLGAETVAKVSPVAEHYCAWCPWFSPVASADGRFSCPGAAPYDPTTPPPAPFEARKR